MADEKVVEQKTQEQVVPEQKTEDKSSYQKRIDELVSQKKESDAKLKAFEDAHKKTEQDAAEKKAKDEGDYKALRDAVSKKEQTLLTAAGNLVLNTLATKHGLAKPEYIKLFNSEIEVNKDTLEVSNLEALDKSFLEFKKQNPQLFATGKPVPSTDNKPQAKIALAEDGKLDTNAKLRLGVQDLMSKK